MKPLHLVFGLIFALSFEACSRPTKTKNIYKTIPHSDKFVAYDRSCFYLKDGDLFLFEKHKKLLRSTNNKSIFCSIEKNGVSFLRSAATTLFLSESDLGQLVLREDKGWGFSQSFGLSSTTNGDLGLRFDGLREYNARQGAQGIFKNSSLTASAIYTGVEFETLITDQSRYSPLADLKANEQRTPKIIWTFWDKGRDQMPKFYTWNVNHWKKMMGNQWSIRVINAVEGSANHWSQFIARESLPRSFELLNPVVKSDTIRLALLAKHGGVWMDPSIILLKPLGTILSKLEAKGSPFFGGFYNEGYGSDELGRKDMFENWFIASSPANPLVRQWSELFKLLWDERTFSKSIWRHPIFYGVSLDNFKRYNKDFRDYLTCHATFKSILAKNEAARINYSSDAQLLSADRAFYLVGKAGWDANRVSNTLLAPSTEDALNDLVVHSDILKFTSDTSTVLRRELEKGGDNPPAGSLLEAIYKSALDARFSLYLN